MLHGIRERNHHTEDEKSRVASRLVRPSSPLKFFSSSSAANSEDHQDSRKAWTANYLADLRSNKPIRPNGSRPLVHRNACSTPIPVLEPGSRPSLPLDCSRPLDSIQKTDFDLIASPDRSSSAISHRRADPALSMVANAADPARTLAQKTSVAVRDFSGSTICTKVSPSPLNGAYVERGQRRLEKQEARLLRKALEEVDLINETRLHSAAQDEASALVWKHQNPGKYTHHGVSTVSQSRLDQANPVRGYPGSPMVIRDRDPVNPSISDDSISGQSGRGDSEEKPIPDTFSRNIKHANSANDTEDAVQGHELGNVPQKKTYTNLHFPLPQNNPFGRRRVSGAKSRKSSGGLFANPDDRIYEEPDVASTEDYCRTSHEEPESTPLKLRTRNSIAKLQSASYGLLRSKAIQRVDIKEPFQTEIHRNPPSQSRNPAYVQNKSVPDSQHVESIRLLGEANRGKDRMEVRGEDIRAATSMRLRDRSSKLPSPTVVTDKPGRPIVSFDQDWRPKNLELERDRPSIRDGPNSLPSIPRCKPHLHESTNSAPVIPTVNAPSPPTIQINDSIVPSINTSAVPSISISPTPSISVTSPNVPAISVSPERKPVRQTSIKGSSSRPSPFRRPLPHHSSTEPTSASAAHWSPSSPQRPTAQCAACALPIAGRIVSAASQRFHPHCFTCLHCGELLECVAFYPEPTTHRESRLARIETRASDANAPDVIDSYSAADDGDSSLRFYCHLDFHELFSPRCRSCKTPIEGEVVLACGGEWHKGHFFCAQCGDPFDEKTPFVEKDGYAWCVGCHAGRFNGKCKGCRKVIVEQGVQALGGEWHERCFCCVVSPGK